MSFFNKIGEKASEVYNTTAEKTNKLTREMKLKSIISENKGNIAKVYQEIGKNIYAQYENNKKIEIEKELSEQLYQVSLYKKEIEKAETEMRSLKSLKLCEGCKKEMNEESKFCPYCGTEQTKAIQTETVIEQNEEEIAQPEKQQINPTGLLNDNTRREPDINTTKGILDIEEPNIIVEEIGEKEDLDE